MIVFAKQTKQFAWLMLLAMISATSVWSAGCKNNPSGPETTPIVTDFYEAGVPITSHSKDAMASYKGQCLFCHGKAGSYPQPYPPVWDGEASGSLHFRGAYEITPGSKADHTSYTSLTDCTQSGCHTAPK